MTLLQLNWFPNPCPVPFTQNQTSTSVWQLSSLPPPPPNFPCKYFPLQNPHKIHGQQSEKATHAMGRKCSKSYLTRDWFPGHIGTTTQQNLIVKWTIILTVTSLKPESTEEQAQWHCKWNAFRVAIPQSQNNKCWQEYGETGTFVHCWWDYRMAAVENSMALPCNLVFRFWQK